MSSVHEQLTEQFYKWELRGRGWQVYAYPVSPEPPFRPFPGHYLPPQPSIDDGVRPSFFGSLFRMLGRGVGQSPPTPEPVPPEDQEEPEPEFLEREPVIELQTSLPADLTINRDAFEQFLTHLSVCIEPLSFEIFGTSEQVVAQFTSHEGDAPLLRRQLQAHFPDAVFIPQREALENAWHASASEEVVILELGLCYETMLLLSTGKMDVFIGIIAALAELLPGELGLFQVIFEPVKEPWSESLLWAVTHADGKPYFVNRPELAEQARTKIKSRLYAAVVRVAAKASDFDRVWDIVRELASFLGAFAHPSGNELIPLSNDEYPLEDHMEDVLRRQSRRPGMILNSEELLGFVHLPSSAVRSPKLRRETDRTKAAPLSTRGAGILLGKNEHAGRVSDVRLPAEERVRHTHLIGGTGMGKSTLLFNLIKQDIENGEGVAVFDPHGDLVDRILGCIPSRRVNDVILIDPSDEEYSVGFNILSAHADFEKTILASDLVSIFERLSTSWGDQLGSVLNNAIRAFLESERGGTLSDLRRFLLETEYRNEFLKSVRDPDIVYYWKKGFPQLAGNKSIGSVITRLDTFLSPKPIRYMVSQPVNRLNFSEILDQGKIFLVRLPLGLMGKENAFLLGSLLVAKFQQMAMSRQRMEASRRRDFWLYIDEFHHFITPSMAEILTGARKYRIGLILAHQELRQLDRNSDVAGAVMSSSNTRVVFRVGDGDARVLASGFSFFEAHDLQNLGKGDAICRVERSDGDFNLKVLLPKDTDPTEAASTRAQVIRSSREKYATARKAIEEALQNQFRATEQDEERKHTKKTPTPSEPKVDSPTKPPLPPTNTDPTSAPEQALPKPSLTSIAKTEMVLPPEPSSSGVGSETPPDAIPPKLPPEEFASKAPLVLKAAQEMEPQMEKNPSAPSEQKAEEPPLEKTKSSTRASEPGRGGVQHKAVQKRLKAAAEEIGYRVTVEKPTPDKKGSVDLVFEYLERSVACEISITTTIDHEVGNVKKCLEADFLHIAVVALTKTHLAKLEQAVTQALGADITAKVAYYLPDDLIERLKEWMSEAKRPKQKMSHGYKVKHTIVEMTEEERKRREAEMLKTVSEAMKRKKKK